MSEYAKGRLIIIGGHEDKDHDRVILKEVCREAARTGGSLAVVTVATHLPEEVAEDYKKVFTDLGIDRVDVLDIRERSEAEDREYIKKLEEAAVIFFTGGDQLRITSQIGDSLVYQNMVRLLEQGKTVAGTSAGAAAMPETMIVGGPSDESNRIDTLSMAPGLGFIRNVIIDSHFAERGRMGRLLGAVAQNPRNLGFGIDEDTAILVEGDLIRVIGTGAVYVVDGQDISYSSLSEKRPKGVISIYNVYLHVLAEGDCFDMAQRKPISAEEMKKEKEKEKEKE